MFIKNKKFNILAAFIFIALLISSLQAGDTENTGLAFLKVDIDGRSAGMAGAFTAISNDAAASYWNPAGLAASSNKHLILTHHVYLADITQEFAAYRFAAGKHHFAASVNIFNIPGVEVRQSATTDPDGVVDALYFYGGLSYARVVAEKWRVGTSVKYLYEKLYLEAASGWVVDLGVQRDNLIQNLDWGFTIQNIGKMNKLLEESTPLPLIVRTGFAYTTPFDLLGYNPIAAADIEYIKDGETAVRIGSEVPLHEMLALRVGYYFGSESQQWTAGLGVHLQKFHFDYAYAPADFDLGVSHRFSLGVYF